MTGCLGGVLCWRFLNARLRKSHVIRKEYYQLFTSGNDIEEKRERRERWQNRIFFPLWLIKALSKASRVNLIRECLIYSVILNAC